MSVSRLRLSLYGLSVALHLGVAASFAAIPKEKKREATAISMREAPRKKPEPPKPAEPPRPPPPPPPDRSPSKPQARAKAAPAEAKPAAAKASPQAPAQASPLGGAADFGLSMSGGVGTGGMAVPMGSGGQPAEAEKPSAQATKRLAPQGPRPAGDGCDEPLVKPRPKGMVQPAYTERAREAKVEGKVRVEISVDEQGRVTSARVVSGLGHGLDEAALAAARQMTFQAASRCGKPAQATFVVSMRFVLGS